MSVFIGICMKIFIYFVNNIYLYLFIGSFIGMFSYIILFIKFKRKKRNFIYFCKNIF